MGNKRSRSREARIAECAGKQAFKSAAAARAHISKRFRAVGGAAYRCTFCGNWHRGASIKKRRTGRERRAQIEQLRKEELSLDDES